mmetsp:Transcript_16481/g.50198  ORF Transcript_16481/g.50198 Transcript_16481/m.50198 type:complete len:91 (+) Transcript_16481:273-545(+)|eukprot:scaffold127737_cov31-Tisochrysis_lutea.AAC.1
MNGDDANAYGFTSRLGFRLHANSLICALSIESGLSPHQNKILSRKMPVLFVHSICVFARLAHCDVHEQYTRSRAQNFSADDDENLMGKSV